MNIFTQQLFADATLSRFTRVESLFVWLKDAWLKQTDKEGLLVLLIS